MAKIFLKNQNIPTKPCPECSVGTIYTGERAKSLNVKITRDGVEIAVCEDCVVKDLISRYHSKEQ